MHSKDLSFNASGDREVKIWLAIVIGSIVSVAVLWLTSLPLGIPGEWAWERAAPEPDWFWNLSSGAVAAGLFIGFVLQGRRRLESYIAKPTLLMRLEVVVWLMGLVVFSFAWIWIVQEISPTKNRLGKSAFVLYYPSSSGYFTRARYEESKSAPLLTGYEHLMSEGDVLHTGTHPPGLFLIFQGLIGICEASQPLSAMLDATQPASFREACDIIRTNTMRGRMPRHLLDLDRRVLWLATVLVMFSASLTIIPLFGLLRRGCDLPNSWTFAAIWPAMPAIAIFVPKSDAMFPLVGVTLLWLWLTAWDRRSLILALLSGAVTWCGLLCSLAFLPVILAAILLAIGPPLLSLLPVFDDHISTDLSGERKSKIGLRQCLCFVAAGLGMAIPTFVLWAFTNLNMMHVWYLNYRNHAAFYSQYSRTYWKWLVLNPMELSIAAGWPVTLLAMLTCLRLLHRLRGRTATGLTPPGMIDSGVIVFVWGALWLTGKNSGEAGRLWILFLPWLIWLASLEFSPARSAPSKSNEVRTRKLVADSPILAVFATYSEVDVRQRQALLLLAMQFAVCLLTVARVNGFHLESN